MTYTIPDGMRNMVKSRAVGNSINRNIIHNNMRSEVRSQPREPEPSGIDVILIGSHHIASSWGIPLSAKIGEDKIDYAKAVGNPTSSAQKSVKRYNPGNNVRPVQSPSFKVSVKKLELKKAKAETSYKVHANGVKLRKPKAETSYKVHTTVPKKSMDIKVNANHSNNNYKSIIKGLNETISSNTFKKNKYNKGK
jgi:hypothetical protein